MNILSRPRIHRSRPRRSRSLPRRPGATAAAVLLATLLLPPGAARAERRILVCADEESASAETLAARDALAKNGAPLFRALTATQDAGAPEVASAPEAAPADRAVWRAQGLDHIVLLGTADEGAAAARTAGTTYGVDTARRELFRLGLGRFQGDIGFVETRMNPWLWSDRFDDNAFSILLVRIGGTTPRGVALAAEAFAAGMNNGVVLGDGAHRVEESILDRDPSVEPPPEMPARLGEEPEELVLAGWSQATEADARAFLDWGATAQPEALWRVKYLATRSMETGSGSAWTRSPAALAWGDAALIARFADEAETARVLSAIRKDVRDARETDAPGLPSPVLSLPMPADENNPALPGAVTAWANGRWLILSSLPSEANTRIDQELP